MPWEYQVNITPLPEPDKSEYLTSLIEDGIKQGAKIMNTSGGVQHKSFFFPAVLSPVKSSMRIYHEVQFGPVIPIVLFNDIEEPMDYVIQSDYGQQASLFGKDSDMIANLMDTLVNQLCQVNINSQCQRGPDEFPFYWQERFSGRNSFGE
jgi:glyceraldehyde-3-phosphate dehydrogenase (NADP+)